MIYIGALAPGAKLKTWLFGVAYDMPTHQMIKFFGARMRKKHPRDPRQSLPYLTHHPRHLTPSSRDFIKKCNWWNKPSFSLLLISFTLYTLPSASFWISLLCIFLPCHFNVVTLQQQQQSLEITYFLRKILVFTRAWNLIYFYIRKKIGTQVRNWTAFLTYRRPELFWQFHK